jgi:transposase
MQAVYENSLALYFFNPLNAELNPICYLLALLAYHFLHVSMIRVKSLTLRLLMSCIYIYIYAYIYTGCSKKSFTTLKAYRNLYRRHTQRFELSKYSKTHRVTVSTSFFDSFFMVPPPSPLRQSPMGHTAAITTITMHMIK